MKTFAERFAEGCRDSELRIIIKKERKALRRTPGVAAFVTLRVTGQRELQAFSNRGWTITTAVPLGRGAGFVSYIMQKPRQEVIDAL